MVRWVPYKHANGMAIYYRQTPADEGMSQVGGAAGGGMQLSEGAGCSWTWGCSGAEVFLGAENATIEGRGHAAGRGDTAWWEGGRGCCSWAGRCSLAKEPDAAA
jgi:hypothetical protein